MKDNNGHTKIQHNLYPEDLASAALAVPKRNKSALTAPLYRHTYSRVTVLGLKGPDTVL